MLLRDHGDLVEADLSRFHSIRYSDRWRFDAHGRRLLTLREIWVRIQYLPHDSALVIHFNGGQPRWGHTDYLLSDIFAALAGKPHPTRPKPVVEVKRSARKERATRRVQRTFAERRRAIEAGEIE